MKDLLIIKPFNPVFYGCFFLTGLACFLFIRKFRHKTAREKKAAVTVIYSITFILFLVYKAFLSVDAEYSACLVEAGHTPFNWFQELPLNLCNINIFLIVIAMLTNCRPLLSFNFYFASLGALFALVMPGVGFNGFSILLPRMMGFYFCHLIVAMEMPILLGLELYRPEYRDIPKAGGVLLAITFVMTLFNLFMRSTGLGPSCNYFFSVDPDGNPLLKMMYSLIPVPGFYLLSCTVIVVPFMLLVTWLCKKAGKREKKTL